MNAPGTRLRALAGRFCSPQTMERLIDPLIADQQHEYADAVRRGDAWRRRWVRVSGCVAFWQVAVMMLTRPSTQQLSTSDAGSIGRTVRFTAIATALVTATLTFTYSSSIVGGGAKSQRPVSLVIVYLVPQVLMVALPLGLFVGVLSGLRATCVTARLKRSLLLGMLAYSLMTLLMAGWLLPAGNQALRELMFGGPVARGTNELTLSELRTLASDRIVVPLIASRRAFDLHLRVALAFAPLALGVFALGVSAVRRRAARRVSVAMLAFAGWFVYYALVFYSREVMYHAPFEVSERVPPIIAAWTANLAFLFPALLLHLRTGGQSSVQDRGNQGTNAGVRAM